MARKFTGVENYVFERCRNSGGGTGDAVENHFWPSDERCRKNNRDAVEIHRRGLCFRGFAKGSCECSEMQCTTFYPGVRKSGVLIFYSVAATWGTRNAVAHTR